MIQCYTGIDRKHLRITSGYKEICPTKQTLYWKQGDKLEVKLKLLGGGREVELLNEIQQDYEKES